MALPQEDSRRTRKVRSRRKPRDRSEQGRRTAVARRARATEGETVVGRVLRFNRGGLIMNTDPNFIPRSELARKRVGDLAPFVGHIIRAKVINGKGGEGSLVLSPRAYFRDQLSELREGSRRMARIRKVTSNTVQVELGGVPAFLELGSGESPNQYREGATLMVTVYRVDVNAERATVAKRLARRRARAARRGRAVTRNPSRPHLRRSDRSGTPTRSRDGGTVGSDRALGRRLTDSGSAPKRRARGTIGVTAGSD